jgi:hypothetical protein
VFIKLYMLPSGGTLAISSSRVIPIVSPLRALRCGALVYDAATRAPESREFYCHPVLPLPCGSPTDVCERMAGRLERHVFMITHRSSSPEEFSNFFGPAHIFGVVALEIFAGERFVIFHGLAVHQLIGLNSSTDVLGRFAIMTRPRSWSS